MMTSSAWPSTWASSGWIYCGNQLGVLKASTDLDGLPVATVNVYSDDGLVERRVGALNDIIVEMLLVAEGIESLEHELEERLQVLRVGGCDKDVGVIVRNRSTNRHTECSGFTTTTGSSEGHCGRQRLFRNGFHKRQQGFGLRPLALHMDMTTCNTPDRPSLQACQGLRRP